VNGLPMIELSEIMATKTGSVDPSKHPDEVFDLYSIPAFDRGTPEVIAGNEIGSAKQIVGPGDVLLSKIVPHIRRSWVVGATRGRRIIAFDPNIRDTLIADEEDYRRRVDRALDATTVLKTSDEDLEWIYPGVSLIEAVRRVRARGVELVVVTRGAEGSAAYTASKSVTARALEVEVSDTIGAGDSFLAALLVWLDEAGVVEPGAIDSLSSYELADALEFASRVSAVTCTRVGAEPPYRSELDE